MMKVPASIRILRSLMRISRIFVIICTVCSISSAIPLSFEQRESKCFRTRFGEQTVEIRPDHVMLGDVTLRFAGARSSRMEGLGTPAPSTYLLPGSARTFRQFPKLAVRGLYPGVDAVFYGNASQLEYDLEIAAGASPEKIRLVVDGARQIAISDSGDLIIDNWRQLQPRVFQKGRPVPARYVLAGRNEVAIRLGAYDRRAPLTIDPVLAYSRTIGKATLYSGQTLSTDAQGNLYILAATLAADFPVTSGAYQTQPPPALWALSDGGKTKTGVSINASSVGTIGGSPDGRVLYAATYAGIQVSGDSGATWRSAATLPLGTTNWSIDQAVTAISVDTLDPATVLVATRAGMFGSTDGGQSWYPRNDGLAVSGGNFVSASTVQYHPTNPMIAYAATSEPNYLYRSTTAGASWQILNPAYAGEPTPPAYTAPHIILTLSPDGNTLYVVDGNGALLKSTDQGSSWTRLGQTIFYSPTDIQVDTGNPNTIYVLDGTNLHRSADGGLTFQKVVSSTSNFGFALDASGAVYLATYDGLQVSTDGGTTFTAISGLGRTTSSLARAGGRVYTGGNSGAGWVVVKLDPTGNNILYSTYLPTQPSSLAAAPNGEVVLVGTVSTADALVTVPSNRKPSSSNPVVQVMKLSADGSRLVYSRLIGGSGGAYGLAVTTDATGAALVGGWARSTDLETTSGALQTTPPANCSRASTDPWSNPNTGGHGFVSKVSADGSSLLYSTYLTGACGSIVQALLVDSAGNVLVGGRTTSPDFPVSANSYQNKFPGQPDQPNGILTMDAGFVTRLNASGNKVLASTFLGGSYYTEANALALDAAGNPVIAGDTLGMDKGATTGAYQTTISQRCTPIMSIGPSVPSHGNADAFVLKLDPDLTTARFLTYLGGGCNDSATGVAVDAGGNVWVSGNGTSLDYPLLDPFIGGGNFTASVPGFLSALSADGTTLLFSSLSDSGLLALNSAGVFQASVNSSVLSLWRIDPTTSAAVHVDTITAVTGYPPILLPPVRSGIAPGQYLEIKGRNLGPSTKVNAALDATGRLPFTLAGVTVKFDNIPAPLISVQAGSILCFAPFEISKSTNVSVAYNGQPSNVVRMGIETVNPQVLSILNADGTANSAEHPARLGSAIAAYVAGMGLTTPLSVDGLTNGDPLPAPVANLVVNWMGTTLTPSFVGAAPGMVAGIVQVNVQLPSTFPAGAEASPSNIYFGGQAKIWVTQ